MKWTTGLAGIVVMMGGLSADAVEIRGQYLEARTCDVYTGPCFANAEMTLAGKKAVMAWKVDDGGWQGVDLEGLSVVVIVRANDTIGDDGVFGERFTSSEAVVLIDEDASEEQEAALLAFAHESASKYMQDVKKVVRTPIEFSNDHHTMEGVLKAGRIAEIRTRKLTDFDCICTNEQVFYQPLADVMHFTPAYSLTQSYQGKDLGSRWTYNNSRSSFLAVFRR